VKKAQPFRLIYPEVLCPICGKRAERDPGGEIEFLKGIRLKYKCCGIVIKTEYVLSDCDTDIPRWSFSKLREGSEAEKAEATWKNLTQAIFKAVF